jgi:2-polyprenyl-3-methyl-5-hydroxy-6-metoxy-1,4-benzoquinol methylase
MDGERLLSHALEKLQAHWATRALVDRVNDPDYDRALAARVCGLIYAKCRNDEVEFDRAIADLIEFSEEFVRLQMELDRTGHYRFARYDEARAAVYDNESVMNRRYLNGLCLSIGFWPNHNTIFGYYGTEFCAGAPPRGRILEVPSGTGIYLSEFARRNPAWEASGMDLSDHAVRYGREIVRLAGAPQARIVKADVFALTEDRSYDRIVCGELLEHLEHPADLLEKLDGLIADDGKIFLTTAIWAASIDHIYLFRSTREAREMIEAAFTIESERALPVLDGKDPEAERTPVNYACVLTPRRRPA